MLNYGQAKMTGGHGELEALRKLESAASSGTFAWMNIEKLDGRIKSYIQKLIVIIDNCVIV